MDSPVFKSERKKGGNWEVYLHPHSPNAVPCLVSHQRVAATYCGLFNFHAIFTLITQTSGR